jgi:DnaJ-class molecular chaperone
MVTLPPDPYNILGVDRKATVAEIRSAYRKLVLKCHPDKVEDPALKLIKQDEFQKVQEAYELLGEQEKRDKYDDKIRMQELRTQFAATSMQPNSSAPRTPPKYNYPNVNVRNAEPPRAQSFPTATASSSKMYSHSVPKSWDESRVPEEAPKTARRTASYDERSSSGKREEEVVG